MVKHLLLLCLILSVPLCAQQRYLVSSNDEIIPLKRSESAAQALNKRHVNQSSSPSSVSSVCGTQFTFGYPPDHYPQNSVIATTHHDLVGQWFVMPVTGTIDALYWEMLGTIEAFDSTIYISIHRSRIGPNYGPGANGSNPFRAPCQQWGYYMNTDDPIGSISPFIDQATDTNWVSTITSSLYGDSTQSPTIGPSLWGGTLGFPKTVEPGLNYVSMLDYDTLKVTSGDVIFISMKAKGPSFYTTDTRTEYPAEGFRVTLDNENYPSRNWKFYRRDSGVLNCSGVLTKPGWVARGGYGDDSLNVMVYNWWFNMTATSNVAPFVHSETVLHNTFGTGPYPVEADIEDCDPASPARAGVASAVIKLYINNVAQPDIGMTHMGGDIWQGAIPGQQDGSTITYNIAATDSFGLMSNSPPFTFSVLELGTAFYAAETSSSCAPKNIRTTGTILPPSSFFNVPGSPIDARNDGTAGPIDLGSEMFIGGGGARYAWVGVNGALALSKTLSETLHVNSNGAYTSDWNFPNPQRNGNTPEQLALMPGNFISPFWSDFWYGDSITTCGKILYQKGFDGDTCLFIVQWDSIGTYSKTNMYEVGYCDNHVFRVCLNTCEGTIEYQYDNFYYDNYWFAPPLTTLVGLQADSATTTAPWIFVNRHSYPIETRPRSGWCIKLYPGSTIYCLDKWNMVSVGVVPVGGDYAKTTNFPTAIGPMFAYNGSYVPPPTTLTNGPGYWAKFNGPQYVGARGTLLNNLNIPVINGWNLIGSIGHPVLTSSIVANGGSVTSSYFGYGLSGYFATTSIDPGYGYWMKMNGAGTLSLNAGAAPKQSSATDLVALNKITIIDAASRQQSLYIGDENSVREPLAYYELPPSAPGFDARYTSGRMVETYPAKLEQKGVYEYPISISEASYPLTIQWTTVKGAGRSLVLTSVDGKLGNTVMNGSGAVRITDASVKNVMLTLSDVQVPTRFALGQNYPNPFNPTTRFTIEMPKTADVTVAIYDILGRQITTLLSGQQAAGYHNLEWDGRDARGLSAPTGIYFIRMAAGEFKDAKKIMLMK